MTRPYIELTLTGAQLRAAADHSDKFTVVLSTSNLLGGDAIGVRTKNHEYVIAPSGKTTQLR